MNVSGLVVFLSWISMVFGPTQAEGEFETVCVISEFLVVLFDFFFFFFFLLVYFRVLWFSSLKTDIYNFDLDDESKDNGFVSHTSVTCYPPSQTKFNI